MFRIRCENSKIRIKLCAPPVFDILIVFYCKLNKWFNKNRKKSKKSMISKNIVGLSYLLKMFIQFTIFFFWTVKNIFFIFIASQKTI